MGKRSEHGARGDGSNRPCSTAVPRVKGPGLHPSGVGTRAGKMRVTRSLSETPSTYRPAGALLECRPTEQVFLADTPPTDDAVSNTLAQDRAGISSAQQNRNLRRSRKSLRQKRFAEAVIKLPRLNGILPQNISGY
jgi:hypothetical protein